MADDAADDRGGAAAAGPPPDLAPLLMDDVVHKLHILNYEQNFCIVRDIPPFHRLYFAIPTGNPAQQYQNFMSLCTFLLGLCKRPFAVDRYEDPTTTITRLVTEVRTMGMEVDFPPLKLRQAYGEYPCKVLDFLCDAALSVSGFRIQKPVYPDEPLADEVEEEEGNEDAEDDADGSASAAAARGEGRDARRGAAVMPDEEEEVLYSEVKTSRAGAGRHGQDSKEDPDLESSSHGVLESAIDPVAWRAEVERVAPRLKISNPAAMIAAASGGVASAKAEWRGHLEQSKAAEAVIGQLLPDTRGSLERLSAELADLLELLSSKERYINSTLKHMSADYTATASKQEDLQQAVREASAHVASLTSELTSVSEALEDVKAQMEDKGSSLTDTSPLIRIKSALASLRAEIKAMDLQTGVVGQAVMAAKVSHKVAAAAKT